MELQQERDTLYDIMCEMNRILSELEWSAEDLDSGGAVCPVCGADECTRKHAQDCKLNATLNRASLAEKGDFGVN